MATKIEHRTVRRLGTWKRSEGSSEIRAVFPNRETRISSKVTASRHNHMRELRTQSGGKPLRTLYAFDPLRTAILLMGGDKTGDDRWYLKFVPLADRLYDQHLDGLKKEGKL